MNRPHRLNWRNRLNWKTPAVGAAVLLALAGCTSGNAETGSGISPGSAQPSELVDKAAGSTFAGFGLDPAQPRPSFVLQDETGASYDFGTRTAGHPTLLFFGYTNCPDECPTTLADMHVALTQVPASVRRQTLIVFVTTDTRRDTGPVIKKWLSNYTAELSPDQVIGLTGTQSQLDAAQAAAGVTIAEDGGETHSTVVTLYGPDDYAHVAFALSNTELEQMVHDLPIVAAMK